MTVTVDLNAFLAAASEIKSEVRMALFQMPVEQRSDLVKRLRALDAELKAHGLTLKISSL